MTATSEQLKLACGRAATAWRQGADALVILHMPCCCCNAKRVSAITADLAVKLTSRLSDTFSSMLDDIDSCAGRPVTVNRDLHTRYHVQGLQIPCPAAHLDKRERTKQQLHTTPDGYRARTTPRKPPTRPDTNTYSGKYVSLQKYLGTTCHENPPCHEHAGSSAQARAPRYRLPCTSGNTHTQL